MFTRQREIIRKNQKKLSADQRRHWVDAAELSGVVELNNSKKAKFSANYFPECPVGCSQVSPNKLTKGKRNYTETHRRESSETHGEQKKQENFQRTLKNSEKAVLENTCKSLGLQKNFNKKFADEIPSGNV